MPIGSIYHLNGWQGRTRTYDIQVQSLATLPLVYLPMAPPARLERATLMLTASCSTTELQGNMVRVGRIELPLPTWQAGVLPLYYARLIIFCIATTTSRLPLRLLSYDALPMCPNMYASHGGVGLPTIYHLFFLQNTHALTNVSYFSLVQELVLYFTGMTDSFLVLDARCDLVEWQAAIGYPCHLPPDIKQTTLAPGIDTTHREQLVYRQKFGVDHHGYFSH